MKSGFMWRRLRDGRQEIVRLDENDRQPPAETWQDGPSGPGFYFLKVIEPEIEGLAIGRVWVDGPELVGEFLPAPPYNARCLWWGPIKMPPSLPAAEPSK